MKKIFLFLVTLSFLALNTNGQETGVIYPTEFKITKPLRDLVKEHPFVEPDFNASVWVSPDRKNRPHQTFVYSVEDGPEYGNDPSIIQTAMGKREIPQNKAILQNFAGASSGAFPPDPTGAVGPSHYVQMVNATTVRIFNKTGTALMSFQLGTLWGLSSNNGDPIVMYDKFADRWFLAQFGSTTDKKIYIAVSQTSDPTGSYYTWTYVSPQFPDYLKFSIWHDGYYMTSNQTTDKVYVFERSVMLTGGSGARGIYSTFTTGSVSAFFIPLPADAADNATLPPTGTPFPFFAYYDNAWGGGTDGVKIWNMTTNWTAGTATIASAIQVNTNTFDASYDASWNDCPQPNGQYLDGIGGVIMYRVPWRSWSGYNNVILTWGVLISNSPRQRAIYWCELRQISGTWSVYQQGIYAPDAATRWMSSAAMDDNGNIALCYAKSSTSIYPGLYYTGRCSGDPLGTMTFAETTAIAGTGSQSTYNRYGDYAHTSLDTDGITFWHTGEYVSSASGQESRIYSFQLPCAVAPIASVSIAITSGTNPTCAGTPVTFTATPVNGGTAPAYQWYNNGTAISGATNSTYISSSLANGNVITCVMTSNLSGVMGNPATSNAITMVVNALPATPTASSNTPVCTGSAINLTTPTVSGATYSWTGPNSFTSTAQNPSITNAATANAGTYSVTVTVSGCTSLAGTTAVVVNAVPSTPTAGSNSPVCEGSTINLTTPTLSGATYNWTGPNSFNSTVQNPSITDATTAMAGTYSVTRTVAGCTSAAGTTSVVVNSRPATPTAGSNSPVCTGTTINLSTPAVSGATYSWTGPNSFTSTLQNPSISAAASANAGTYSVTVTVAGCTSLAGTTTVVVSNPPSTPTPGSNSPVCAGSTINLTTPTVTGATYSWTGPNSFTSTLQNPSISNATLAMAGDYSVTVAISGCTSPAGTTNVSIVSGPATPTASSNSPVCTGGTLMLSTPTVSGATYSWTGPNSFTSALQNPTITNVTTANSGTYSVTITQGGCPSLAGTTTVVVNALPATPAAGSNSPVCAGSTINLTTPAVSGATYSWTGPNSFTSTAQNPSITNAASANAGTYSVTVTLSGCTSLAGTTTVIVNSPPATPAASSNSPVCVGSTINLTTPTVTGATYSWTGPNSFTSTAQNPSITNASAAMAGTYSVTVTVSGCTSLAGTTNVLVNSLPSTPTASSNSPVCAGSTINLTTPTVTGATYSWTGPNSFTSTLQNPTIAGAGAANAGTYSVTITQGGCTSLPGTTVVALDAPSVADFTGAPTSTICSGFVQFTDNSTGNPVSWLWDFGDGQTSSLQNPLHTYIASGVYTVSLTATNACGSNLFTRTNYITINTIAPPSGTGASRCGPGTLTLNATGAGTIEWYDALAGGNLLASGTSFTTPSISTTTTYYAEDHIPASTQSVGPAVAGSSSTATSYLIFDVSQPMTLISVQARRQFTGNVIISLQNSAGTTLQSTTVSVGSAVTTITLNWAIPVGTNYRLVTPNNSRLYRMTSGVAYPYSIAGLVSITGCSAGSSIYSSYFNWQVQGQECRSARLPVVATVNPVLTPAVTIAASASAICAGTSVIFTATPTNGGTPAYQWLLNGANTGTNSSTYANSGLVNGDIVSCVMTSSVTCASPASATSNAITMTVNPVLTPAVTIAASASAICAGTLVTFTATPTNGGTPAYQWLLNGSNTGTNSSTYTNSGLVNGDIVSCVMTSSITCASPASATSNAITMTVNPVLTPSVSIVASASAICAGTSVIFTATPTNGGTPAYQWLLNGSNTGTNSSTYANSGLVNGDIVSCVMTSSITCASPASATSNAITMTVNPVLTPSVSIAASASAICAGTSVIFTATPTNGGTPAYQWLLNGASTGTNSSTYANSGLVNGDIVSCVMTSSLACASPASATSNAITMTVNPVLTPSVSIAASASTICAGTSVTFTATPTNGGTPAYQWLLNGSNTGTNSSTYTNSGLVNGDIVSCVMTSTETCASPATASSNAITMVVNTIPAAEAGNTATYSGTPIPIGSASNGPGIVSWLPAAGLDNASAAQPLASPSVTTIYTVSINNNGCTATDTVTVYFGNAGHVISGKTRYLGKAIAGSPAPNLPIYQPVKYSINKVIVKLKSYPGGVELATDTSDAFGTYQFANVPDGNYILAYDKYTADTMQTCDNINVIDLALLKYYIGHDTVSDPSRNFKMKYKLAGNVDNSFNAYGPTISSIDLARINAKIGLPNDPARNFPKGNWVALDTLVTVAGSDLNVILKTICYGDYDASGSKYRDSATSWNMTKSLPKNIISQSDETITINSNNCFDVPLRMSTKINELSALGLELSYPDNEYILVGVTMPEISNNKSIRINPTWEEILANDNDLLVTDIDGTIRVVFATTKYFDVAADDEIIRFSFRSNHNLKKGPLDFKLSGPGVIANQYGEEDEDAYLLIPKIFVQGNNNDEGFELTGYPNPFSGDVTLTYNIPESGTVKLKVFNAIGELVTDLVNEARTGGRHAVVFSQKDLPAGMYTFKLEFTGLNKSKCLVLKMIH